MRSSALALVAGGLLAGCGFVAGVDFFDLERGTAATEAGTDADVLEDVPASEDAADGAVPRTSRLFVMGGTDDASTLPDRGLTFSAAIHEDGTLGPWERGPDLPAARVYAASVAGADFVGMAGGISAPHGEQANFFLGGASASGTISSFFESSDAFATPRARAASAQHGSDVFVVGGVDAKGVVLASVQHGAVNAKSVTTFAASPPLPAPRGRLAVAYDDSDLFVVGGSDSTTSQTDILVTHFGASGIGAFTTAGSLPSGRVYLQAAIHGGALLVVGGENPKALSDVLRYPILAGGMLGPAASTAPLPVGAARHQVVVHEGHLYVIGGISDSVVTANVFVGDLTPDGYVARWRAVTSLPAPLMFHSAAILH